MRSACFCSLEGNLMVFGLKFQAKVLSIQTGLPCLVVNGNHVGQCNVRLCYSHEWINKCVRVAAHGIFWRTKDWLYNRFTCRLLLDYIPLLQKNAKRISVCDFFHTKRRHAESARHYRVRLFTLTRHLVFGVAGAEFWFFEKRGKINKGGNVRFAHTKTTKRNTSE